MPFQIKRVSACPPPGDRSGTLELIQAIQEGPPYRYARGEVRPAAEWVPALVRPPAAFMYLASTPDGATAGYCVTLPLADYGRLGGLAGRLGVDEADCRYIAELGVAPAHRREGIARALLQAALGDRQAQAASYLVRTLAGNLPAIRLYRSLGFSQVPDVSEFLHGRPRIFLRRTGAATLPAGSHDDSMRAAAVFGRAASSYDRVIPFFATFAARLAQAAGICPGDRVLDVACGTGACAAAAGRHAAPGGMVVAADLAPPMVAQAAAGLGSAGCRRSAAVVMDACRLGFADAVFDVVLCGFGMSFFPSPLAATAAMRKVLRPGGRIAASTFPPGSRGGYPWFSAAIRAAGRDLSDPDNSAATASGLRAVLQAAGFTHPVTARTQAHFIFPATDAYVAWTWSHGGRRVLETMTPSEVDRYRTASAQRLLRHIVPGGYELVQQVDLTVARATATP